MKKLHIFIYAYIVHALLFSCKGENSKNFTVFGDVEPPDFDYVVKFEVTGTVKEASFEYSWGFNTYQTELVDLPVSVQVGADSGAIIYLSATNPDSSGSVTAKIFKKYLDFDYELGKSATATIPDRVATVRDTIK